MKKNDIGLTVNIPKEAPVQKVKYDWGADKKLTLIDRRVDTLMLDGKTIKGK